MLDGYRTQSDTTIEFLPGYLEVLDDFLGISAAQFSILFQYMFARVHGTGADIARCIIYDYPRTI